MKFPASLFFSLVISALCALAQDTPATFLQAVEEAMNERNAAKLDALLCTTGMSDEDKALVQKSQAHLLNNPGIDTIEMLPLPEDFRSVFIMRGKKMEPTAPPVGLVRIKYKQSGNGINTSTFPYAVVDGQFRLIGVKSTDLNWKGPEDKNIGYMVMGTGADKLQGTVKWNASGVDQEKPITSTSLSFMGQYIQEVSVTSDSDDTDVTITIMENGKPIFESAPLKGKGTQAYKRTP
jgi:hypothetical protein